METIIIYVDNPKIQQIKDYLRSLNVRFEVAETESLYDDQFVSKIERSKEQARQGQVKRIKTEDLWK